MYFVGLLYPGDTNEIEASMGLRELLNLFSLRAPRSLWLLILFFTAEIAEKAEKADIFLS